MIMQTQGNHKTVVGTIGGTLLSLTASVHADDLVKTALLALLGAVVSFAASMSMRWVTRKVMRK
jgi:hypothetical protein